MISSYSQVYASVPSRELILRVLVITNVRKPLQTSHKLEA